MKKLCKLLTTLGLILSLSIGASQAKSLYKSATKDCLYQISTLQALIQGGYDAETTVQDLMRHGNTGLGTFEGLDGEMIIVDGKVYKGSVDGNVYEVKNYETVPFANIAFINNCDEKAVSFKNGYDGLKIQLNNLYPMQNVPTVFYIKGDFKNVTYRSVPKQKKPYPKLTEVVKNQAVFTKKDIKGIIVGFRFPSYMQDINANGYHLHFISSDKKYGGHLLNVEFGDAKVKAQNLNHFELFLPNCIKEINFDKIKPQDVVEVEK